MPVVIAGLILSFLLLMLFGDSELDRALLALLGRDFPGSIEAAAAAIHWLARPLPLLILVACGSGLLASRRRWRDAALLAAITLSGWLATLLLQRLTAPLRPLDSLSPAAGAIYPDSGAACATIAGVTLAFLLTRQAPARAWALAAAAAAAIAAGLASVVAVGMWPSGVIGGWALGLAWSLSWLLIARTDVSDGQRLV